MHQFILDNARDIEVNLFASAIALIIDLVITLIIINRVIAWRENSRWLPVKRIVLSQFVKTYESAFNAAYQIAHLSTDQGRYPPYDGSNLFLRYVDADFSRLRTLVDTNSVALGSELLPDCALFMDKVEGLLRGLHFLKEAYNPARKNQDIVGSPPFEELREMENVANKIKRKFEKMVLENIPKTPIVKSASEIEKGWHELRSTFNRLHFEAGEYSCDAAMLPLLMDVVAARKLGAGCLAKSIQVFYD